MASRARPASHAAVFAALFVWASLTACIGRDLDRRSFACQQSGPACLGLDPEDAGAEVADSGEGEQVDVGARDSGMRDSGVRDSGGRDASGGDATTGDAGRLPPSCAIAVPLPLTGQVTGDTSAVSNWADGTCNAATSASDEAFSIDVPVRLARLRMRTVVNTQFNAVLHVYRDTCEPAAQLACDTDSLVFYNNPQIELTDVAPGRYYLFVDGQESGARGQYTLSVEGLIDGGGACDPERPFLRCADGFYCGPTVVGGACLPVSDCVDALDNDGDGFIDEDATTAGACINPPVPDCAPPSVWNLFEIITYTHGAQDDGPIAKFDWSVQAPSLNARSLLWTSHGNVADVYGTVAGDYRVRFTAVDAAGNAAGCESPLRYRPSGALYADMLWSGQGAQVELHLLSPQGAAWFDETQDCRTSNCSNGLPWGGAGLADDAHSTNDILAPGPEAAWVTTPARDARGYALAVEMVSAPQTTRVSVRLFCNDTLQHEFGGVELTPAGGDGEQNPFWIVADVVFGPSGCTFTPRGATGGGPLIVPRSTARGMR